MVLASTIFTIVFIIIFLLYLVVTCRKSVGNNFLILGVNILSFLEAFLLAKGILRLVENSTVKVLSTYLRKSLNITKDEWIKDTSLNEVMKFLAYIILGIIIFIVLFMLLKILNYFLKKVVLKIFAPKKKKKKVELAKNNLLVANIFIGSLSFIIISFAFLFPLASVNNIYKEAIKKTTYKTNASVKAIANNPILNIYSNNITVTFFDNLTDLSNKKIARNSDELKGMTTMAFALLDLENNNISKENVKLIKENLVDTYLMADFISEVCSNAALRWKNGQSFMGKTLNIPENNTKTIYMNLLDIISKWERKDVVNDITTIFEVYELFNRNAIKKIDDIEPLIDAFSQDEFCEELFLTLFHNDDFKSLLPIFMNFAINTGIEKANLNMATNIEYINLDDINKMNDKAIKKEAKIFSLVIRQIKIITKLNIYDLSLSDVSEILSNLKEID